jgi:hypothetical protein
MKGFALGITLLFLFLLTLCGFAILLIAGNYYSSVRNLMENENARMLCESATEEMVDRHNLDSDNPRFFFDPLSWQKLVMKPYKRMGYTISANLSAAWNPQTMNRLTVSARKGQYLGEQLAGVSQIRLENFAFYSDTSLILPLSSLFDGLVFVRDSMELMQPEVRFREVAQGRFFPEENASFRRKTSKTLSYPEVTSLFTAGSFASTALTNGIMISGKNPLFWQSSGYQIDLNLLQIDPVGKKWQIRYKGTDVAITSTLLLWFDDVLIIRQADQSIPFFSSQKPKVPLYLGSGSALVLESSLLPVEGNAFRHPLCLISAGVIRIASKVPFASRFQSCLIALGADPLGASLVIDPGGTPLSILQKDQFMFEVNSSPFLFEDSKREAVKTALENQQKIVWFRGSVITESQLSFSGDVNQVHFQASSDIYPLLPSLPFVRIVEGSKQWR